MSQPCPGSYDRYDPTGYQGCTLCGEEHAPNCPPAKGASHGGSKAPDMPLCATPGAAPEASGIGGLTLTWDAMEPIGTVEAIEPYEREGCTAPGLRCERTIGVVSFADGPPRRIRFINRCPAHWHEPDEMEIIPV